MTSSAGPRPLTPAIILAFASAGIPGAALATMMGNFMPRFFAGHMGLKLTAVGAVIASVRLIDTLAIDLPLGWAMDHTRTRLGRYRPWYILGAPVLLLAVWMLFNPPTGMTAGYLFLWYFIYSIGSSMMVLAHSAWAANLATDYHQRSRIFGWMAAIAAMGSVSLLCLPFYNHGAIQPGKPESIHIIGLLIIGLTPLMTLLVTTVTPEPMAPDVHRGKVVLKDYWDIIARPTALRLVIGDLFLTLGPGLTGPIYVFFFNEAKGFTVGETTTLLIFYIGATLVGAPVWARVARRFGKHQTLQIGCVCYAIAQTTLMAIPKAMYLPTAIGMFSVGFSASAFGLMVRAMLADYGDQLRLEQGVQRVSLLYSFVGVTLKIGTSFNVLISFAILDLVGFQASEKAHNTAHAIFGLEMVYLFAPIIFVVIGGALFFGYSLDATRHGEIRAALDERDKALAEAEAVEPHAAV